MLLHDARRATRVDPEGTFVTLEQQDRSRWDAAEIAEGLRLLPATPGPYQLQAAIAACHATARTPDDTDWSRIATLYAALVVATDSPIVELNRAVAVGMADGPQAGLAVLDDLIAEDVPVLRNYHLLFATRGDLLAKLGRRDEARQEFERAAELTANEQERELLLGRARDQLADGR
jgi:RNA polymerase sigma-70 factor (ECF subfamily)